MEIDPLQLLLTSADSAPACVSKQALIAGVRSRVAHRAKRRVVAASTAAVIFCAAVVAVMFHTRSVPPHASASNPAEIANLRAELADLNASVESHRRIAAALQFDRARYLQEQAETEADPAPDLLQRLASARSRAALLIVHEAERAASTASDSAAIRESYQRAARLFPETPAGRLAAARLKSLGMVM